MSLFEPPPNGTPLIVENNLHPAWQDWFSALQRALDSLGGVPPSPTAGLQNIPDGTSRFAAAEAGADVTANHQSATTASLSNQTQGNLADDSTYVRMPSPPAASAAAQTSLSQNSTTTGIVIGAGTYYLGVHQVSAGSGSVDPGSYGTWYIYFDVPNMTVTSLNPTYQATSSKLVVSESPYRVYVGSITTASSGGGSGGFTGGCFSGDTRVLTTDGFRRFDELPSEFEIVNHSGVFKAKLLVHRDNDEPLRWMGRGFVTINHLFKIGDGWVPASQIFHEKLEMPPRTVYNMEVQTSVYEDKHYILENGLTAHNIKP